MADTERSYIAIDLKSFYASVECKERQRSVCVSGFQLEFAGNPF